MQKTRWFRRAVTGVIAGVTVTGGLSIGLATAASATSTFTLTRVSGTDRYGTACAVATRAYNANGTGSISTVLLADGLPGHQSDALAAPFLEAALGAPILLTDNSNTVPQNTISCLAANKVKTIDVIGGTGSVSQGQLNQLSSAGYTVNSGTYSGATRFDTMEAIDTASGTTVGTTGSPAVNTAILASGDDNHLVDALGAGPLAFGDKLPIILTESTSSTLPSQAQAVISKDNIKKLIVVGGSASVPSSQYSGLGLTIDSTATTGADRGATSALLAGDEVSNYGGSNEFLGVAAGATYVGASPTSSSPVQNDGADALSSAPLLGNATSWANTESGAATSSAATVGTFIPLVVSDNPTDYSAADSFASSESSTLAGPSPTFGGPTNNPQTGVNSVITAGGGTAPAVGAVTGISPTSGAAGTVVSGTVNGPVSSLTVYGCGIGSSSAPETVTTDSNGNFTVTIPTSQPNGACTLTFSGTPSGGGAAVTTTETFTVGSSTSATCSDSSTTAGGLPVLCAAKILQTVGASNSPTPSNPEGTTVQFIFNQPVNTYTLKQTAFLVYDASDNAYGGNAACTTAVPTSNCQVAAFDATNTDAVDVDFYATTPDNLTTTAGASALTLATVAGPNDTNGKTGSTGPAISAPDGPSPDGAAPIAGSSSTTTLSPGVTSAPDLTSVSAVRAAATSGYSAVDFTFDKAAYVQNGTAGPPPTSSGFDVVLSNGLEESCTGPGQGSTVSYGSTVPGGGNGSTTITVICANETTAQTTTLTVGSGGTIARGVVQPGTVGTSAPTSNPSNAYCSPTQTADCNPLEASTTPHTTGLSNGSPTLSSTLMVSGASSTTAPTTTPDSLAYIFDQAVNVAAPGTDGGSGGGTFKFYTNTGQEGTCTVETPNVDTTPGGAPIYAGTYTPPGGSAVSFANGAGSAPGCLVERSSQNFALVVVQFSSSGVSNSGSTGTPGALATAVGSSVVSGAVTNDTGTVGLNGTANDDDSLPLTNTTPASTLTAGQVAAPQLTSVTVNSASNPVTGPSYSVTYTFTQNIAGTEGGALTSAVVSGLHAYAGTTELTCTKEVLGSTSSTENQVICEAFDQDTASGADTGTGATGTQESAITYGTVDYGAVTAGNGATNSGTVNPEGGQPSTT